MDVVFLDANVLFSAAYRADAGLRVLWEQEGVRLVTSGYALEEAHRNLAEGEPRSRLERLVGSMEIIPESDPAAGHGQALPNDIELPAKDLPILQAAMAARASHLLTGDTTHFGRHLGTVVWGFRILTPSEYLRRLSR